MARRFTKGIDWRVTREIFRCFWEGRQVLPWHQVRYISKHAIPFTLADRNSLAYLEAYVALASVMRRFSLELFETDTSDVEVAHDFFLPCAKLDSKGVRVKVLSVDF
jgi:hypothetical protein